LINIRRIKGAYIGENIIKVIILILVKIRVVSKLGFFIRNNIGRLRNGSNRSCDGTAHGRKGENS
jgi:hypothetical protein